MKRSKRAVVVELERAVRLSENVPGPLSTRVPDLVKMVTLSRFFSVILVVPDSFVPAG
jgi:hypothetical protein